MCAERGFQLSTLIQIVNAKRTRWDYAKSPEGQTVNQICLTQRSRFFVCVCELADCGQLIQCTCCGLWCVYSLSSPSAKPVPSLPGLSVFTQLITCSFPCCLLSVFAISLHPSIVCVVAFPASLRVSVCFMFLINPKANKVVISLS